MSIDRLLSTTTRLSVLPFFILLGCNQTNPQSLRNPATAFTHINLVPMTAEFILPDQTVVVEGDRVVAVGHSDSVLVPRGAHVVDGTDLFLLPGLADMHMHFPEDGYDELILKMYLANGVTTIRSLNGSARQQRLRARVLNDHVVGPSIYLSGPIIGVLSDSAVNESPDLVTTEVSRQKEADYDAVKLYTFLGRAAFDAALAEARQQNIYTVGHIPYAVGLDGVIEAGMDEIAHVEELLYEFLVGFDRDNPNALGLAIDTTRLDSVLTKVKAAGIRLSTTLAIDDVIVQKLENPLLFLARPESAFLPADLYDEIARGEDHHQRIFSEGREILRWYDLYRRILARAGELEIQLICGTDAGAYGVVHGYSIHDELRIMADAGFSPFDALRTATALASTAANAADEWGTIEIGKRADLVMLTGNPLENLDHLRVPVAVMAAGRLYTQHTLESRLAADIKKYGRRLSFSGRFP